MEKRGQFSAFFVAGILIILMIGISLYLINESNISTLSPSKEDAIETQVLPPLKTYIERCLLKASKDPITTIGLQGGTLDPSDYVEYYGDKLNYLCLRENSETACRNSLLTVQQMEYELEQTIISNMLECVDLELFKLEGAVVEEGELNVRVKIGSNAVRIEANYPINITERSDKITKVDEFFHTENVPLGGLYDLSQVITNEEIKNDDFDKDEWMIKNNAKIIIQKHKPYPNKVYILEKDDYIFQFGIQGAATVGLKILDQKMTGGCCINGYDGTCFANVPEILCREIDGDYDSSVSCSCPSAFSFDLSTELGACESTYDPETDDFTGPRKKHGESWCHYESIVGKGYDYVGSRHFLHSCIDGKEIIEECRDFREELCTEYVDNSTVLSKAECRVNRWYDCSACDTKECCENNEFLDCYWNDWLEIDGSKCSPQVPPGLKFWEREGSDVCFRANKEKTCEGLSCPNNFIDSSSIYCYKQGDCGNYRNTEDIITTSGFFETDLFDSVRGYTFLPPGFNRNYEDWVLRLPLGKTRQKAYGLYNNKAESPIGNIPSLIQSASGFIDDILKIEFSDFLKPFKNKPVIEVTDYAICDLWSAPVKEANCNECGKFSQWPCTEYKCKSLGERCVFENKDGFPSCKKEIIKDDKPPLIKIDPNVLDERYYYEEDMLSGFSGYHIMPKVLPYKPLKLGIITNEPTKCKLDYAPTFRFVDNNKGYYALPSIWFGEPTYNTSHFIRFRTPPKVEVPQKILDFLNFSSTKEFSETIDNLGDMYNGYKEDYKDTIKFYEKITGSNNNLIKDLDPMVDSIWSGISILVPDIKTVTKAIINQYSNGGYYLFVKCIDMAGNENEEQFYFKFEVDENMNDTEPPVIEVMDPKSGDEYRDDVEIKLYLDEPAECRFDYEDKNFDNMNFSFDCVSSAYQISPVDGGTYKCNKKLSFNETELKIFIRCADNPERVETYKLHVKPEKSLIKLYGLDNITDYNASIYASVNQGLNLVEASADFLSNIEVGVPEVNMFKLGLFIDDPLECRYDAKDVKYADMKNEFSTPSISKMIEKGQYFVESSFKITPESQNLSLGKYSFNITVVEDVPSEGGSNTLVNDTLFLDFGSSMSGFDEIKFNDSILNIELNVLSNAECRFSEKVKDYSEMDPMSCNFNSVNESDVNSTKCFIQTNVMNKTLYFECNRISDDVWLPFDFFIKCADKSNKRNFNQESIVYSLNKGIPLKITSFYPIGQIKDKDVELKAGVNKDIKEYGVTCGYTTDLAAGFMSMSVVDNEFVVPVKLKGGEYNFFIRCEDRFGSRTDELIRVEVLI